MTLIQFFNCLGLCYAPPLIVYKTTRAGAAESWPSLIFAALAYVANQLTKMLIIASAPMLFGEAVRVLSAFLDLFAVYLLLPKLRSDWDTRILSVAIGWSFADSLFGRFVGFWLHSREMEFDAGQLFSALSANFELGIMYCTVKLVAIYIRKPVFSPPLKAALVWYGISATVLAVATEYSRHSAAVDLLIHIVRFAAAAAIAFVAVRREKSAKND